MDGERMGVGGVDEVDMGIWKASDGDGDGEREGGRDGDGERGADIVLFSVEPVLACFKSKLGITMPDRRGS